MKNPNVRGKISKILEALCKNGRFGTRMQEYKPIVDNIVPCMVRVFVAVEKTKQSYYDIRMQLKYQLRVRELRVWWKVVGLEVKVSKNLKIVRT